jgi:uncharacterized protein YdeI (YjbR/CyaY-like superfamily)
VSARPANVVPAQPAFFATVAEWRAWLERHHGTHSVLWVGFHRKGSGRPSITYADALDGALCFGWIDGVRKAFDATSYVTRFTPRKARSIWSDVNTKRYRQLLRAGLVRAAGRAAFARRTGTRAGLYSHEQPVVAFPPAFARTLQANRGAWAWFQAQPPSYRRAATWWVISAKQPATRERRLATLVADSAAGRTIAPLTRKPKAP